VANRDAGSKLLTWLRRQSGVDVPSVRISGVPGVGAVVAGLSVAAASRLVDSLDDDTFEAIRSAVRARVARGGGL
jgi:hypothetical protein